MKLRIFHGGDGDCVLLSADPAEEGAEPVHVLVDGGRRGAFRQHARGSLYELPHLDVVCVSHIDEDHIAGIIGLVRDEVDWRVHDFRRSEGEDADEPDFPRPPEIREIWHNAVFELVGDDLEPQVHDALATRATLLAGSPSKELRELASRLDSLATGERSAMELSRRISDEQLGIPRNRPVGEPMLRDAAAAAIEIGPLAIRVLGPSQDDLELLRDEWKRWIDNNRDDLEELQAEMLEEEERLGELPSSVVARPLLAADLGEGVEEVTEPNLASLMLYVEEGDTTVLLTGDGVTEEILTGLGEHDLLDDEGRLHVTVLKVQHHGALANVERRFVDAVTADHYLFCGNGAHENPELEVVEAFARARLEEDPADPAPHVGGPFTFWFSTAPDTPDLSDSRSEHMQAVVDLMTELRDEDDDDRFSFELLRSGALDIEP